MNCPNCGHDKLNTVETMQDIERTVRYKKCPKCEWRFTSVETIPDIPPIVSRKVRQGKGCK